MLTELHIIGTGNSATRTREAAIRLGYVQSPNRSNTLCRPSRTARLVRVLCGPLAALDSSAGEADLQVGNSTLLAVRSFVRPGTLASLGERLATPIVYWPDLPHLIDAEGSGQFHDRFLLGVPSPVRSEAAEVFGLSPGQSGPAPHITSLEVAEHACVLAWYRAFADRAITNETRSVLGEEAWLAAARAVEALGFHRLPQWNQPADPSRMSNITSVAEDQGVLPYLLYGASRSISLHGSTTTNDPGTIGDAVCFHEVNETNGFMSNFSNHAVHMRGKIWPTMEHYYQGSKFQLTQAAEAVRTSSSPGAAKRYARRHLRDIRPDWDEVKVGVMRAGLLAKFSQHPDLRSRLLATGDLPLVELSQSDRYWGRTGEGQGLNMLGQLLMSVREELRGAA
jgi:N-glycosidase YbiA